MRRPEEIRARIARIEADSRYQAPLALVAINAPLALVQIELKAEITALRWVLDIKEEEIPAANSGYRNSG